MQRANKRWGRKTNRGLFLGWHYKKKDIEAKYQPQVAPIKSKLALRGKESLPADEKKLLRAELKTLTQQIV